MESPAAGSRDDAARHVPFGLRYGLVVLPTILYVAVLVQWLKYHCSQDSVSAYYFTPVQPLLVTTLSAIGFALILHPGNSPHENAVLDVAGFMAVVVALVPTTVIHPDIGCVNEGLLSPELSTALGPGLAAQVESAYVARRDTDILAAVGNSVVALIVAGVIGFLLVWLVHRWTGADRPALDRRRSAITSASVAVLLTAGIVMYRVMEPATFRRYAHPVAAVTFFVLVLVVMYLNWRRPDADPTSRRRYLGTGVGTIAAMLLMALLHDVIAWVFWLETVGVAGFVAFWAFRTLEPSGGQS